MRWGHHPVWFIACHAAGASVPLCFITCHGLQSACSQTSRRDYSPVTTSLLAMLLRSLSKPFVSIAVIAKKCVPLIRSASS